MNPRVSVIINNFNYARFLREAVESALEQSTPPFEVIVVDDGSSDDSRAVIESFGSRVHPVFKENGGQGSAFNRGFAESRGDWALFLDADDWLHRDALEVVAPCLRPGVSHLYYRLQQVNDAGEVIGHFPPLGAPLDWGADAWRDILDRGSVMFPPTSGNVFARETLRQILPMPEATFRTRADVCLLHKAAFHGEVVGLDDVLASYRVHGANLWYTPPGIARPRVGSVPECTSGGQPAPRHKPPAISYGEGVRRQLEKLQMFQEGAVRKGVAVGATVAEAFRQAHQQRYISQVGWPRLHPFPDDTRPGTFQMAMASVGASGGSALARAGRAVFLGALFVSPAPVCRLAVRLDGLWRRVCRRVRGWGRGRPVESGGKSPSQPSPQTSGRRPT